MQFNSNIELIAHMIMISIHYGILVALWACDAFTLPPTKLDNIQTNVIWIEGEKEKDASVDNW